MYSLDIETTRGAFIQRAIHNLTILGHQIHYKDVRCFKSKTGQHIVIVFPQSLKVNSFSQPILGLRKEMKEMDEIELTDAFIPRRRSRMMIPRALIRLDGR